MPVRRFNTRPLADYSTPPGGGLDFLDDDQLKFYLVDTFAELPTSMNIGDQAYVISNNTFWIANTTTTWSAMAPSSGSDLTVQEEDGSPIDTATTILRFPNGSLIDNGAGDVSVTFTAASTAAVTRTISGGALTLSATDVYVIVNGEGSLDDELTDIIGGTDGREIILEYNFSTEILIQDQSGSAGTMLSYIDSQQRQFLASGGRGKIRQLFLKYSSAQGMWMAWTAFPQAVGQYSISTGFTGVTTDGSDLELYSENERRAIISADNMRITTALRLPYTVSVLENGIGTFGVQSVQRATVYLDTEFAAASDNNVGFSYFGGTGDNTVVYFRGYDATHVVTMKHNDTGSESVAGTRYFTSTGADVVLDDYDRWAIGIYSVELDSGAGGWFIHPLFSLVTQYTDEMAQDAVGGILGDSASIDFTYNDGVPSITAVVLPAGVDHGGLAGLADDDHPQYALDTDLSTHAGAADPHAGYVLESAHASPSYDAGHHAALTIGADAEHSLAAQVLSGVDATTSQKGHAKFDSTNPAAIGTAAPGASGVIADRAHVHPTGAGTPSTQAFGDAASTGSGPAAAMTDHKHAMPANPVTAHEAAGDPHTGYRLESVALYVTQIIGFQPDAVALTADTLNPRAFCVGESGEHGALSLIRAKAVAGTAGAGTNTIIIEADDNPAFTSATTIFTLALNTSTEVDDTSLDNSWASGDIFLRARCTAVNASAPQNVVVTVYMKQAAEAY